MYHVTDVPRVLSGDTTPLGPTRLGNVNKYVVHLGAGSPLKFHGVPANDRTLPRAMGRGTHLCFPDAGMLHKFHVVLAYLRNSAATRALWQKQRSAATTELWAFIGRQIRRRSDAPQLMARSLTDNLPDMTNQ